MNEDSQTVGGKPHDKLDQAGTHAHADALRFAGAEILGDVIPENRVVFCCHRGRGACLRSFMMTCGILKESVCRFTGMEIWKSAFQERGRQFTRSARNDFLFWAYFNSRCPGRSSCMKRKPDFSGGGRIAWCRYCRPLRLQKRQRRKQ